MLMWWKQEANGGSLHWIAAGTQQSSCKLAGWLIAHKKRNKKGKRIGEEQPNFDHTSRGKPDPDAEHFDIINPFLSRLLVKHANNLDCVVPVTWARSAGESARLSWYFLRLHKHTHTHTYTHIHIRCFCLSHTGGSIYTVKNKNTLLFVCVASAK